jgi:signal transduction histidine kinase
MATVACAVRGMPGRSVGVGTEQWRINHRFRVEVQKRVVYVKSATKLLAMPPMNALIAQFERLGRTGMAAVTTGLVLLIGIVDYTTGAEISLSVIYVLPVALATWFVGPRFAMVLAVLSAVVWIGGDVLIGQRYSTVLIPIWNTTIRIVFYAAFVALLTGLHELLRNLEVRVRERAADLTKEISERERLERELLVVSEREQRRIGQDLHDGLCQHLTGTALASQVLAEKLAARDLPEAGDARKIVELTEEGIALSRNLAKGLNPVEMQVDGLMQALDDFAETTSDLFKVACKFECEYPVLIRDPAAAAQLYWIAHEAVGNAIKHGLATDISINLEAQEDGGLLRVEDNGHGVPEPIPANGGMGLRIMAHRAKVIGATFAIRRGHSGGTTVICAFPPSPRAGEVGHA